MNWDLLANTIAVLAAASGLIVFLAKAIFSHLLTRDIERFKAELKASHDSALECLRADLRIQAFERETTFSRLHDKRVQVIEQLYQRIVAVSRAMNELTSPIQLSGAPSVEARSKAAGETANAFLDYYLENQIYFDEALCDQLQAFNERLRSAWIDYHLYGSEDQRVAKERREAQFKAWKTISEELPEIRREIEQVFRKMLGHIGNDHGEDTKGKEPAHRGD